MFTDKVPLFSIFTSGKTFREYLVILNDFSKQKFQNVNLKYLLVSSH